MSSSRTFMSPYFLTALAILPLTICHQTASSRTCPFFNQFSTTTANIIQGCGSHYESPLEAPCVRNGNVQQLYREKVSVGMKVYFKLLKAQQEICFIRILENVLV